MRGAPSRRKECNVVTAIREFARTSDSAPSLDAYWEDIKDCEPVSREHELELVGRVREGDTEALDELVTSNLRFVVSIAKEYGGRGQPLGELISDGNLGLIEAVRRFDETRGFKLITYAVWWIRQAIQKGTTQRRNTVPPPTNRMADWNIVQRAEARLCQELGRVPTDAEVAERAGFNVPRVDRAREVSAIQVRLDRPVNAESDEAEPLGSCLVTEAAVASDEMDRDMIESVVNGSLSVLDDREYKIIRWYFGFDGHESMTLEAIGGLMGLTRERIRQLRDRALRKLRACFNLPYAEFSPN
jgi:RNA polymerase primary sigma factor